MNNNTNEWESRYTEGKLDFLDRPHEQLRHAVIGCLISQHARGEVIDLGCGRGHQLMWLRAADVTRYVGVDVSATALEGFPASSIPVEKVVCSIENYHPPRRAAGALICAEALYFVANPAGCLKRIANELESLDAIVVSLVVPSESKPNWRKDVDFVWGALAASGWPLLDRVRVSSSAAGIAWDVAIYRPGALARK